MLLINRLHSTRSLWLCICMALSAAAMAGCAVSPEEATPVEGSSERLAVTDSLGPNRDRLLTSYFNYLKAYVTVPQSNGLSGSNVSSVCDVWNKLVPSAQDVFLTLTARMQGGVLGRDGSSMLSHVTKIYRIAGGQNATASNAGSCGGGEYNRMIMSMDAELQSAQLAANNAAGGTESNGLLDISDIPPGTSWRNSWDLGGPHAPFDISDETENGGPRGQTQYFQNPSSTLANSPLGRMDLQTLVDPYALEMDQDYNCPHDSNPLCTYVTYGPLCLPEWPEKGTTIYEDNYGSFDPSWKPTGC